MAERFNRLEGWVMVGNHQQPQPNGSPHATGHLNIQVPNTSVQHPFNFNPQQFNNHFGAYTESGAQAPRNNRIAEERNIPNLIINHSPGKVENTERGQGERTARTPLDEYLLQPSAPPEHREAGSQVSFSMESDSQAGHQGINESGAGEAAAIPRLNLDNILRAKSRRKLVLKLSLYSVGNGGVCCYQSKCFEKCSDVFLS